MKSKDVLVGELEDLTGIEFQQLERATRDDIFHIMRLADDAMKHRKEKNGEKE